MLLPHINRATNFYQMELKLIAAYLDLQLDPEDDQRMAAFEALCWRHVLHHASIQWVQHAQSGIVLLERAVTTVIHTKGKVYYYDHTLNHLTSEFMQSYASIIWPSTDDKRSHLTSTTDIQLKAVEVHMRARTDVRNKLERDMGQPCIDLMIVVESVIGRRIREFLKELVKTRAVPLLDGYSVERLLQTVLGRVDSTAPVTPSHPDITSARYPCPYEGCGRIYAWSEALTTHLNTAHPVIDPGLLDTTVGSQTPLPSLTSPDDQRGSDPPSTSGLMPTQWGDMQMGPMTPVPSGINSPYRVAPIIHPSLGSNAEAFSPISLENEEDDEDDFSGLLCSHAGCPLRFPDWASFDAHAQQPHNAGSGV
jgi:hypothetical protein